MYSICILNIGNTLLYANTTNAFVKDAISINVFKTVFTENLWDNIKGNNSIDYWENTIKLANCHSSLKLSDTCILQEETPTEWRRKLHTNIN